MIRIKESAASLAIVATLASVAARAGEPRFPLLSDAEAWAALPGAESGGGGRLPSWARATARALPRTTAAVLDLDRLHRTRSPLGPVLRGKMRWVAADANNCDYARATAEGDLRRAGLGDGDLAALKGGRSSWAEADRRPLAFARTMTLDAASVTDAEVEHLRKTYGEEKLTAMVLLLAAANFQDRLLLTLGSPIEAGGPMPPLDVRFDRASKPPVPPRARPVDRPGVPTHVGDPSWSGEEFDTLQKGMEVQRGEEGRVRVPTYEEMLARLPEGYPKPKSPVRIKWSLVCMTYQPELAAAWSACTNAFREEARQDRVFEESLFWVVTRTIHCFY